MLLTRRWITVISYVFQCKRNLHSDTFISRSIYFIETDPTLMFRLTLQSYPSQVKGRSTSIRLIHIMVTSCHLVIHWFTDSIIPHTSSLITSNLLHWLVLELYIGWNFLYKMTTCNFSENCSLSNVISVAFIKFSSNKWRCINIFSCVDTL